MKTVINGFFKKYLVYLFLTLFIIINSGCSTHYRVFDQHKNDLSLMIIRTNIPQGYAIKETTIKSETGKQYSNNYTAPTTDNVRNKLIVFENLPSGKYRLKNVYARTENKTSGSYTTWSQIWIDFNYNRTYNNSNAMWFKVKPSEISYIGNILWLPLNKKSEFIKAAQNEYKKSREDIEEAILYSTMSYVHRKGGRTRESLMMIRLDHPSLVGKRKSLLVEKYTLMTFLPKLENYKNWKKLVDHRIGEINSSLTLLSSNK